VEGVCWTGKLRGETGELKTEAGGSSLCLGKIMDGGGCSATVAGNEWLVTGEKKMIWKIGTKTFFWEICSGGL